MKEKSIVIGAGGHARSLIGLLKSSSDYPVVTVIDLVKNSDLVMQTNEIIDSIPVVKLESNGLADYLLTNSIENVFLAIGDNKERAKIKDLLESMGKFKFPNIVSKHALVEYGVTLGDGNQIFHNVYLGPLCRIGSNNIINSGALIEHECIIGDNNHIAPSSSLAGRVKIASNCLVGLKSAIIEKLSITSSTILGAGSVVVDDIDKPGTYVGVPCKKIKNGEFDK